MCKRLRFFIIPFSCALHLASIVKLRIGRLKNFFPLSQGTNKKTLARFRAKAFSLSFLFI